MTCSACSDELMAENERLREAYNRLLKTVNELLPPEFRGVVLPEKEYQ